MLNPTYELLDKLIALSMGERSHPKSARDRPNSPRDLLELNSASQNTHHLTRTGCR
ncbi:hypothetical protein MiSe_51130 [Microseira wollei NIES-4236]|uniref:Transposase n=1 Tax=Microseira wollei NIES-4236 TaxID=2530354 RepID=A0AAV3XIH2_9CYAN|nr:hypothetical protein MiSe_51130 [Microseira wollei NIES-4236]